MNKPCSIHFHWDTAPLLSQLPERYRSNVTLSSGDSQGEPETVLTLVAQNAFLIDFSPEVLRTRVGGGKSEDPIDFPLSCVSFIEWHYGEDVPAPLKPEPHTRRNDSR